MISELLLASALTFSNSYRREVANTIYDYLYRNALRDENNPLDYAYPDAYELHWTAKELYSNKPVDKILCPDSVFERGAYKYNIISFLEHENILAKISKAISVDLPVPDAPVIQM